MNGLNKKLLTIFILVIFFVNIFIFSSGGGLTTLVCIFETTDLDSFWSMNQCVTDVGVRTRTEQMCNLFIFSSARYGCKRAYAIKNNRPDICLVLPTDNDFLKSECVKEATTVSSQ